MSLAVPPSRQLRVLVVDDSPEIRELFCRLLALEDYEVLTAVNGADGVRLATMHCPDVVIMDMSMPVLDGGSAIRLLRGNPDTAAMPVIAVTGDAWLERCARDAGCDEFLMKPVRRMELLRAVRRLAAHAMTLPRVGR